MPMDSRQQLQYLKALGIPVWVPVDFSSEFAERRHPVKQDRTISTPKATQIDSKTISSESPADNPSHLDWTALEKKVQQCTACGLHEGRTQTVFGTGSQNARVMVIGEAPGADEDIQGKPFVGRAGKLLDEMLKAIGLQREEVYIANIVKCQPPGNRNPQHDEALHCAPYLQRQIALIGPKVIFAVGKVAAQNLLQIDLPIGKMRGNRYHYDSSIPVIVTYHPAYLLRSPREKRKSWQDLKRLQALAG